jgi:mono/diheme cytochrome c family protein
MNSIKKLLWLSTVAIWTALLCGITIAAKAAEIDYAKNVAPIFVEQCQSCHREGGIAPWAMTDYRMVQAFAPAIKEAVVNLKMPPGQIDRKYADVIINHRTLSDLEMSTIVEWVNAGAPVEGDRDPLTETVYSTSEWVHGEPDMVIEVPPQEIPAVGTMGPRSIPYRYVGVDLGLTEDKWLRGSQFLPSEPTVMHHMLNSVSVPGERNGNILGTQGAEQQNMDYASVSAYVPGGDPDFYDENTGGLLRAGSTVNLQLHYTPDGTARTDEARIGLYFHDEGVVPEDRMAGDCACIFPNNWTTIPAFDPNFVQTAEVVLKNDVNLHTFLPHMHFRGKSMKATAFYPDGTSEELIDVPRYDYAWQLSYTWREPKFLPAGTRLFVEGAFDNSADNPMNPDPSRDVPWGQMSEDEMFFGAFTWKNLQ